MGKARKGPDVPVTQATGMFPLCDSWDGPHMRLFRCGMNDFRESAPPITMFLDSLEPLGCWEYVLSGALYYKVGTKRYRINAGEALLTCRPDPGLLLRPVEDVPLRTLWLFIKDEAALRMFDYLHVKYGAIQQFSPNSRPVRLAGQLIELVAKKPQRSSHFWSEKTFQWMNACWLCAQENHGSWTRVGPDVLKPTSFRSQTPETVKSFATQMGYSRSYLSRKLTKHWACSPGVVLREVRLQKAATLLRSTQLSIGEIAVQVGYGASAAFGRAFLQYYKQTPRAYRHSHQ